MKIRCINLPKLLLLGIWDFRLRFIAKLIDQANLFCFRYFTGLTPNFFLNAFEK